MDLEGHRMVRTYTCILRMHTQRLVILIFLCVALLLFFAATMSFSYFVMITEPRKERTRLNLKKPTKKADDFVTSAEALVPRKEVKFGMPSCLRLMSYSDTLYVI